MSLPECPEGNDGQSQDKGEDRDNQDCQDKVLDLKMNQDCLERVLDLKSRLSDKVLDIKIAVKTQSLIQAEVMIVRKKALMCALAGMLDVPDKQIVQHEECLIQEFVNPFCA